MKKTKHLNLDIKTFNEQDGSFTGYGSVWGVKDQQGDVVTKGAFTDTIVKKMPKLLWQHDPTMPIGKFTEIREDSKGLHVQGQIFTDTTMGGDAYKLLKGGAVDGLSIGYFLKEYEYDKSTKTLFIKAVDLIEVSLVTFPANEEAQVESVKSEFFGGELNKELMNLTRRVRNLELQVETKIVEESTEVVEVEAQEKAEAESHDVGEVDGAETKALDMKLAALLSAFKA